MLHRRVLVMLPLVSAACTFTGLGNYEILTCASPAGSTSTLVSNSVTPNSTSPDLTFTNTNPAVDNPVATFVPQAVMNSPPNCVYGVDYGGASYILGGLATCSFLGGGSALPMSLLPRQPWAIPIGGGYAVAVVGTTAPCTVGQIWFEYDGTGIAADTSQPACGSLEDAGSGDALDGGSPTGASLPSLAGFSGGTTAILTWYEASIMSRTDPIDPTVCGAATAAPLVAAVVNNVPTGPMLGPPVTLTAQSTSMRPAAPLSITGSSGSSQVVIAAPNGNDVGIWTLDSSLGTAVTTAPAPVSVPGLANARAVSIATDDSQKNFAIVAEIGCQPAKIALAIGTLSGGFTTTVIAQGTTDALQPTVAWAPTQAVPPAAPSSWAVSWISLDGGAHAVAMRFDSSGTALGPQVTVTGAEGATVTSDGNVMAYVPSQSAFVKASLGCVE
jgi:hypothetical protein